MKKRLGTIPKGLEWISQSEQTTIQSHVASKASNVIPAARRGLQEDLTRATFILKQEYLDKIKAYAYWERLQIKDVLEQMCDDFFDSKKVRSIPDRKKE